jgi:hypothetical protein
MNITKHEDDDYWKSERQRMEEEDDPVESHSAFSLGSIFSRLPRFE